MIKNPRKRTFTTLVGGSSCSNGQACRNAYKLRLKHRPITAMIYSIIKDKVGLRITTEAMRK